MAVRSDQETADLVIAEVLRIIESEGYNAVGMRGIARGTRLSLTNIYRLFPSREDLIITAVETWLAGNSWSDLTGPRDGESVYDATMRILRLVIEPWERNPRALEAYYRAMEFPKGKRLRAQTSSFGAVFGALLGGDGSVYLDDSELVLWHVISGAVAAFVNGELDIIAVLPTLERAVFRLTTNNEPEAEQAAALWSGVGGVGEGAPVVIPEAVDSHERSADIVIADVLRVIESEGYEAVEMRGVARRTHVSTTTIYQLFPSREDLIITAVETWLAGNSWSDLTGPRDGESVYDTTMRILRQIFEHWKHNPRALEAFYRAMEFPRGKRLRAKTSAFGGVFLALLGDDSPAYLADFELVLTHVIAGVVAAFVTGELDIKAVLPALERAVFRLTTNNEPEAEQTAILWSGVDAVGEGAPVVIPGVTDSHDGSS